MGTRLKSEIYGYSFKIENIWLLDQSSKSMATRWTMNLLKREDKSTWPNQMKETHVCSLNHLLQSNRLSLIQMVKDQSINLRLPDPIKNLRLLDRRDRFAKHLQILTQKAFKWKRERFTWTPLCRLAWSTVSCRRVRWIEARLDLMDSNYFSEKNLTGDPEFFYSDQYF